MSLKCFLSTFAQLFIFSVLVHGQVGPLSNTTSTPVPGDQHYYVGDLNELVNPANGAVSVRILAPTPHDRGINLPLYAYIYDSNGQFILTPSWGYSSTQQEQLVQSVDMVAAQQGSGGTYFGTSGMYPSGGSVITGGQPGSGIPGTLSSLSHNISGSRGTSSPTQINCTCWDSFIYTNTTGGRHALTGFLAVSGWRD